MFIERAPTAASPATPRACARAGPPVARKENTSEPKGEPPEGIEPPLRALEARVLPLDQGGLVSGTGGRVSSHGTRKNVYGRPCASFAVTVPASASTVILSWNLAMAAPLSRGQSAGGAGTQSRGYLLHCIGHGAGRWTLALLLPHVVGLAFRARGGVVDGITHGAGLAVPACRLVWWCCGARRRRVAVALPARSPLDARRCVAPLALKPRSGLPSCSSIALAAGRAESSVGHEHASPETIGSSRQ